jgi:hypothetical protein
VLRRAAVQTAVLELELCLQHRDVGRSSD